MFKAHLNSIVSLCYGALATTSLALFIILTAPVTIAADIDPTRPFGVSAVDASGQLATKKRFVLSSIIHGDGIHTAVINGKIYKMFDYVGEYKLTAINSHSVILRNQSKRLKINIFKSKGFKSNVLKDNVVEDTVAN